MRIGHALAVCGFVGLSVGAVAAQQPYERGAAGVRGPFVLKLPTPMFTPQEGAIGITVTTEAVVLAAGTVGDVRVVSGAVGTRAAGLITNLTAEELARLGLDRMAIAAAKDFVFRPATKDGTPVPVKLPIEINLVVGRANPIGAPR